MLRRVTVMFAGRHLERLLPVPRNLPLLVANRFAGAALPRLVQRLGPGRFLGGMLATAVVQHLAGRHASPEEHDTPEESDS